MTAEVFDNRRCELGEGPLWHPERGQLFWFDILAKQLLTRNGGDVGRRWQFDEHVSAAGWIDRAHLLIASETQLFRLNLETGRERHVIALEAGDDTIRSNDGRADRQGGFWIGTMSKSAEAGRGAIHRFHKGELRKLVDGITIPNGICFSPDGTQAYYACTIARRVWRVALDGDGWPTGTPEVFLDLRDDGLNPDGAVVDATGQFWNAQWGAFRVACYAPDGTFQRAVEFPAAHTSCPAFGGPSLSTLFCTTALEHLDPEEAARSENGMTFSVDLDATGLPEPQVQL